MTALNAATLSNLLHSENRESVSEGIAEKVIDLIEEQQDQSREIVNLAMVFSHALVSRSVVSGASMSKAAFDYADAFMAEKKRRKY